MKYSINEIFYSLQGEGSNAGTPAVFIRFAGCNLHCPFCDTDFKHGVSWSIDEIIHYVCELADPLPPLVVLTGGEPTLQADADLCRALHRHFKTVAIETNGTRRIPLGVDFVTASPKDEYNEEEACFAGTRFALIQADEVKVIYPGVNPEKYGPKNDIGGVSAKYYFLQPKDEGDPEKNKRNLSACVEYIKAHPWWRLSLQTQKILKIR